MSALDAGRRERAGWATRDHVRTCTTCRGRVRDTGPFAAHPDDRETGHHDDCTCRAAELEAWHRETQGGPDA